MKRFFSVNGRLNWLELSRFKVLSLFGAGCKQPMAVVLMALTIMIFGVTTAWAGQDAEKIKSVESAKVAAPADSAAQEQQNPIEATPEDIIDAYQNNSENADQTYLARKIKLSGLVDHIGQNDQDEPFVAFKIKEKDLFVRGYFSQKTGVPALIKKGQNVFLICTFRDIDDSSVNFVDCSIDASAG